MVLSTAFLASKVSHSGLAVQPLRKIRKGKLQETVGRLRKYGIEIEHTLRGEKSSSNKLFEDALFHLWDRQAVRRLSGRSRRETRWRKSLIPWRGCHARWRLG
jgi:hypothetical protein